MFRISPQGQNGTSPGGLLVSVVDSPPPDDQIISGEQVEVSVEPSAALVLNDKELDASVVGTDVSFTIDDQHA
jgi:Fe-S cluster assembly iron-binding protein IscA